MKTDKTVILIQAENGGWDKKFRFWIYRQLPFMRSEDFHDGNLVSKGKSQATQIGAVKELLKHLEENK
jgi:hypothetical protein